MSSMVLGKLALITGAGSGIGRATCLLLAKEGAKVIAADRNLETAKETISKIKNEDNSHTCLKLTVNEPASVHGALEKIIDIYKQPPNVIVNCAGITRDNFTLKLSLEDFNEVIDVNLKGTFLILQTFAAALVQREIKNGSIINISSIVGKYGNLGQTNYSASKAGVELLTKTAAKELGKFGIRVNFVRPGFIESPMTETVPENVKQKFIANIPFHRFGKPHEVAEAIAFLASDRSSYINGASIDVTGGL